MNHERNANDKPIDRDLEGQGYVAPPFSLHGLQHAVNHRNMHIDPGNVLGALFFATEFAGEAGEACNVVKKLERERLGIPGRTDTPKHLGSELADTIITACNIARLYNIDLTAEIRETFNRTSEERQLPTRI
jgi:NTP pyrophosphatase (non-canonical NTP hydrolase)